MQELNQHLLRRIGFFLEDPKDIVAASSTCKHWRGHLKPLYDEAKAQAMGFNQELWEATRFHGLGSLEEMMANPDQFVTLYIPSSKTKTDKTLSSRLDWNVYAGMAEVDLHSKLPSSERVKSYKLIQVPVLYLHQHFKHTYKSAFGTTGITVKGSIPSKMVTAYVELNPRKEVHNPFKDEKTWEEVFKEIQKREALTAYTREIVEKYNMPMSFYQ